MQRSRSWGLVPHGVGHVLVAVLSSAVIGCSTTEEAVSPDTPRVDVGHGLESFIPLDDGDRVEMVFGVQGRWHVDLASHFGNVEPEDHITNYRIWDVDRIEQIAYPVRAYVTPDEVVPRDDGFDQVGVRTVFAVADGAVVADREWLVEVELIVGKDVYKGERVILVVDEEP